ncbi:MAG: response regulator [Longimonas sp.]|uniref:response regulator n=1 Tax=Longimonas sp. TaxID=2039626 RepID=UPI00335EA48B
MENDKGGPLSGRSVLIVDDEPNIRRTLKQALARTDAIPLLAEDGTDALRYLDDHAFDAVLLDLRLPDVDGIDLIEVMQEAHPEVPIIAFSAHASAETAAEAVRRGAVAFLEKPFRPEQIRQAVAQACSQKHDMQPLERGRPPSRDDQVWPIVVALTHPDAIDTLLQIATALAMEYDRAPVVGVCTIEVPMQTALKQAAASESMPRTQRDLIIQQAQDAADRMGLDLAIKTLWTRTAHEAVNSFLEEQQAEHLVIEWPRAGDREQAEYAGFSPKDVQHIAQHTQSEVSLVKRGTSCAPEHVGVVVRETPDAASAVRRGWSLVRHAGVADLTLVHVRATEDGISTPKAHAAGERLVARVLREAGIPTEQVQVVVQVADDPDAVLAEAVQRFDTLCVDAARRPHLARFLFGATLDPVETYFDGTVVAVYPPRYEKPSLIDALVDLI